MEREQVVETAWQATGTDGAPNLQQVAAERLAAHRNRRAAAAAHEAEQETRTRQHREAQRQAARDDQRRGASMVREAVVARYEQRESYREFLATEAERALQQAEAEAEVAARSARAVAEAQLQLLEELDRYKRPEPGPREVAFARAEDQARGELAHALADIVLGARELISEPAALTILESAPRPAAVEYHSEPAVREISASGLTVRLFDDMPVVSGPRAEELSVRQGAEHVGLSVRFADPEPDEHFDALEEELAFRRAPEFPTATPLDMQPIPGNLIEFPRELIAPRRARPRLAEGPLMEEADEPQLRIFEVDAELSAEGFRLEPETMPEWQSMMLESVPPAIERDHVQAEAQASITLPPQTASIERRLMAAAMDGCIVTIGWLGAVAAVAEICGPALRTAALPLLGGVAVGSLGLSAVLFQLLFFSLSDATPGMRWARIGLCTFGDSNPSRQAMRRRVLSTLLAACPLGLGLAWIWMDNDSMGWHDRMSRMYQRAY